MSFLIKASGSLSIHCLKPSNTTFKITPRTQPIK